MLRWIAILGISGIFALTGCQNNATTKNSILEDRGQTIKVKNNKADLYNDNANNVNEDFSYTRHQKVKVLRTNEARQDYSAINREHVSNIIGKNAALIPYVDDVSTFV